MKYNQKWLRDVKPIRREKHLQYYVKNYFQEIWKKYWNVLFLDYINYDVLPRTKLVLQLIIHLFYRNTTFRQANLSVQSFRDKNTRHNIVNADNVIQSYWQKYLLTYNNTLLLLREKCITLLDASPSLKSVIHYYNTFISFKRSCSATVFLLETPLCTVKYGR